MTTSRTFQSRLMREAWLLARQGAATFGGNASMYFAAALRAAWAANRPQCLWFPGIGDFLK